MTAPPPHPGGSLRVAENLRRVSVGDCELRYLRIGSGRPLVLLHTLRTQLEYFLPLLDRLDLTMVEVVALDLPGHGQSTAPGVEYTAEYFTATIDRFLAAVGVRSALVVGESIGGSIALGLAARRSAGVARVVALNAYDYGRRGGIRRSSAFANVIFTAMLWPVAGAIVARSGTKGVLRRILEGGVHDRDALTPEFIDELYRCGSLPGHARAFQSLCRNWKSWIDARERYKDITLPVTVVYADHDWSRPAEREMNLRAIPGARSASLRDCGHFSCLEKPEAVARIISADA